MPQRRREKIKIYSPETEISFFCKRSGGVTKGDVEIKEIGRYY
ncbi:MAG: hypothetical protein AB1422_05435 [bacterium]